MRSRWSRNIHNAGPVSSTGLESHGQPRLAAGQVVLLGVGAYALVGLDFTQRGDKSPHTRYFAMAGSGERDLVVQ